MVIADRLSVYVDAVATALNNSAAGPWSGPRFSFPSRFIATSADIVTSRWVRRMWWDSGWWKISGLRISVQHFGSSGHAGIFPYQPGFAIMCTSHSEVTGKVPGDSSGIFSSHSHWAGSGMEHPGTSLSGAFCTDCSLLLNDWFTGIKRNDLFIVCSSPFSVSASPGFSFGLLPGNMQFILPVIYLVSNQELLVCPQISGLSFLISILIVILFILTEALSFSGKSGWIVRLSRIPDCFAIRWMHWWW